MESPIDPLVETGNNQKEKPFEPFELAAALLLGLGAIGAALSGYQSGLWGGKSTEAYGLASTMATKASAEQNYAVMDMSHDFNVDIQAKKLILEGNDATDEATQVRSYQMASYLYTVQMSETGYKDLGLPMEFREGDASKRDDVAKVALETALENDLGNDYVDLMLADSAKQFKDADKKFDEGRYANDTGDTFDLIGVIYAVGLFFAGLSLIFKTRARWIFLAMGAIVVISSTIYLFRVPWA